MPTYDFEDTKTGKVWTDMMSISEKEVYLKKNKHIKQLLNKINISSGVMGVGQMKTDGGWKDMLSRIGDAHPGSKVHDIYGNKSTKDIQTRQVVKKHQKRQAAQRKARGK